MGSRNPRNGRVDIFDHGGLFSVELILVVSTFPAITLQDVKETDLSGHVDTAMSVDEQSTGLAGQSNGQIALIARNAKILRGRAMQATVAGGSAEAFSYGVLPCGEWAEFCCLKPVAPDRGLTLRGQVSALAGQF